MQCRCEVLRLCTESATLFFVHLPCLCFVEIFWHRGCLGQSRFLAAKKTGMIFDFHWSVGMAWSLGPDFVRNHMVIQPSFTKTYIWGWVKTYLIINSNGMNIHKSQLFWGSLGARVLTNSHINILFVLSISKNHGCPLSHWSESGWSIGQFGETATLRKGKRLMIRGVSVACKPSYTIIPRGSMVLEYLYLHWDYFKLL